LAALDDVAAITEIDQKRIYLAGISNGGLGVSQLAEAAPGRFRGLIFISPVMATEIVESKTFLETWRGRPVLVISGEADRRISISYVNQRVTTLQKGGVAVTDITYSNEDHFLFFSQPANVLADIATWLQVYSFSFHTLPRNKKNAHQLCG
jgi:pimeloyl-ACP methyl ester carboxylesterase